MFEAFERGDRVELSYLSDRSGGEVSRTGTVLQVPEAEDKRGFFVQTDEDQLTGVMGESVYSLSVGTENGERTVQRKTYLGEFEDVTAA
jgi:hypothetical protein